jgi:hypothetical protein
MTAAQQEAAPKPSSDEISQQIVTDINKGALSPGEWLKQIDLEKRYGCTRIKVRDALTNLHSKRLVEHIPNRGYRVPQPDPLRIRQVGEVRRPGLRVRVLGLEVRQGAWVVLVAEPLVRVLDLVAVVAGHEIGHFLEVHGIGKPLRPAPVLTVVGIAGKTFRLSDHVSLPTAYPAGPA